MHNSYPTFNFSRNRTRKKSSTIMAYNPIPFDHTYIVYDPSDLIATVCVQFSLLPIYVMVFYTSWFLITREIEPAIVVGGHLIGEIINKVIKHIVRQPRPDFHKDFGISSYGLSYGMPSAHSQFMGFFAVYFMLNVWYRVPMQKQYKYAAIFILTASAVMVAFSRVYLLYHNVPQVVVGVVVGATFGMLFYVVVSVARSIGLVDWVLGWPVVRQCYVKDSYYHCYQSFAQEHQHYRFLRAKGKEEESKR